VSSYKLLVKSMKKIKWETTSINHHLISRAFKYLLWDND